MRDADVPFRVQHDDSAVAVQPLLQVVHRFLRGPLRQISGGDPVRRPLRQHQLHDRFAPSRGGDGSTLIVRIASAANQRRVAQPSGSLVQSSAGRSRCRDVALTIESDRAYGIVRNVGCEQIVATLRGFCLIFAESFYFAGDDQIFILAKRDTVFGGETLRAFADKINVGAFAENLSRCAHRIVQMLDAAHASSAQRSSIHDEGIELHLAVAVQKAAASGVESLVVFHDDDGFLNGVERRATALEHMPSRGQRIVHATDVGVHHVIRHGPGAPVNDENRISWQELSPR